MPRHVRRLRDRVRALPVPDDVTRLLTDPRPRFDDVRPYLPRGVELQVVAPDRWIVLAVLRDTGRVWRKTVPSDLWPTVRRYRSALTWLRRYRLADLRTCAVCLRPWLYPETRRQWYCSPACEASANRQNMRAR